MNDQTANRSGQKWTEMVRSDRSPLFNGAEYIGVFFKSVASKVNRRHSYSNYDRLKNPIISKAYFTMGTLPRLQTNNLLGARSRVALESIHGSLVR